MGKEISELLIQKERDYLKSKGIKTKGMTDEQIHKMFDKLVKELENEG